MKKYYYSDGVKEAGPFTFDELKDKEITKGHLVWFDPMKDWQPAGSIDELGSLFTTFDISKPAPAENSVYQSEGIIDTEDVSIEIQKQSTHITVPEKPTNYLWQSIVVTIIFFSLCTLPFGVAGIVNAIKVNSTYARGDYAGALRASNLAKQWTTISFVIGCVLWLLVFISLMIR